MILIQEVIREVVSRVAEKLQVDINFQCGDAVYVNDQLQLLSSAPNADRIKYPLFLLYMPIKEDKTDAKCYAKVSLRILIATLSEQGYDYEQRLEYSFKNILHPIYEAFIEELKTDNRFIHEYYNHIPHTYVDNYQYGYHGAVAGKDEVFDKIDGIDITNLKLTLKNERICKNMPHSRGL